MKKRDKQRNDSFLIIMWAFTGAGLFLLGWAVGKFICNIAHY